jgi:hypothetical protein
LAPADGCRDDGGLEPGEQPQQTAKSMLHGALTRRMGTPDQATLQRAALRRTERTEIEGLQIERLVTHGALLSLRPAASGSVALLYERPSIT